MNAAPDGANRWKLSPGGRVRLSLVFAASLCAALLVVGALQENDAEAQPLDDTPTPSLNYLPSVNLCPPQTSMPRVTIRAETMTAAALTPVATRPPTSNPPSP